MGFWTRFKSSITGLFVKADYARANPETTFAQKVKKPSAKKDKAKASRVAREVCKAKKPKAR